MQDSTIKRSLGTNHLRRIWGKFSLRMMSGEVRLVSGRDSVGTSVLSLSDG